MPWLQILILLALLYALYCMLVSFVASPAWVHSPAATRVYAERLRLFSARPSGQQLVKVAYQNATGMFAEAVGSCNAANAKKAPLKTSVDQPGYPKLGALTSAPSYKVNALPPSRPVAGANIAIKRTANGLRKPSNPGWTFSQAPTSTARQSKFIQSQIEVIDRSAKSLNRNVSPQNVAEVFITENDFDSDIDLDNEDVSTKDINCPTLPRSSRLNSSVTHPFTHRASFHSQANHQAGHVETQPESDDWSSGTQELPWSSSPIGHLQSSSRRSPLGKYAFAPQTETSIAASSSAAPEPKKRRGLPWTSDKKVAEPPVKRREPGKSKSQTKVKSAVGPPLLSDNTASDLYPWNTTVSAKTQQKELRRMNKKNIKEHEGTIVSKAKAIAVKKSNSIAQPCLSNEQRHVLELVVEQGKSVFFTGSAGTGKSVLLREMIGVLRKKHSREPDRVAVTASTGLAACNVGGVTLHSFAGIGLGKEGVPELVKKIRRNQKAKQRWMRTKILVIDEISMVDGELFDKLEGVARQIRNNGRPFGGIQLVITGDFFQLPPVPDAGRAAKFSFDAATWPTSIQHTIGLHHVFRQKDPVFAGMLNEMREGRLSEKSIATFRKLSRQVVHEEHVEATELFPTRIEVDNANNSRMRALTGEIRTFEARDGGTIVDKVQRDKLLQNCMAPQLLDLKPGAQVMLIKNMDETLVNGSLGKVRGFMSEAQFDTYGDNALSEESPHLSTMDETADLEGGFARKHKMKTDLLATSNQQWPVVRFAMSDGTTRDLLCNREVWKVELPNGEVQAQRAQVPLILAWSLSIHKAQGQTLERVKVDLGKVFEKGQAYVALSRATTMEGLQVLRFDPKKVMAHERVRNFYASLSRAEHEDTSGGEEFEDHDGKNPMASAYL